VWFVCFVVRLLAILTTSNSNDENLTTKRTNHTKHHEKVATQ
jgi:hypothetical protein